jgi:glutaconate CoA-transferase subunit B
MNDYTPAELMVVIAAHEIANEDVVFVGMRLPLLGFQLAKTTHAPNAIGLFELGIIRDKHAPEPILTMGDLPNLYRSQWLSDTADIMGLLQRGLVDLSFIGGAQVDRYGNLNTTYIGGHKNPKTRLPGSGGACDLASLAKRHIIIMNHEKRRFVPRVDFITSPGYGEGRGWREAVGLPRGGPSAVITTLGVLRSDPETDEMMLTSTHPGVTVEQVIANTGWSLKISPDLRETPNPTQDEITTLRKFDLNGFWTRNSDH